MFVKLWMKKDVISIAPEQTLAEAAEVMQQNRIRRLLVTQGPTLVGIISQHDIQKGIPANGDESTRMIASQSKVEAYMTHNPITAEPMDPLEDIALSMRKNKIGGIPVLEDGTLVGIITESDIFRALTEILGAGKNGARVELKIGHSAKDLFQIVKLCKQFDIAITAISIFQDFSPEHQLLTVRLDGEELDGLIDALWESGCQINRIMRFDEEGMADT
ncbi:MAG: CBS domain-containing protein [Proteobacteria bacterium]|nr:CBS domain-containing protein [Pseudomonadota bacterium]MCG2742526.1 CBS domain-containing protein [Desulfobacteraceae bacterium]MBU3982536.1 CBS domain-containing protein [Pseudomonadota bacterium]MBU4028186.1 CBS domain-containing protein [Pseudomonadota bacterium]MBU4041292.1 CBS domain-containing protein [Pseudomonadota bacterium]